MSNGLIDGNWPTHLETTLDERYLIKQVLAGDADAERQLYETHVDRVFRLAYRMTGNATQAEDLTQDIFIRAFNNLARFRGEAMFSSWLYRIATSVIYSALRKERRKQDHITVREDLSDLDDRSPTGDPDLRRRLDLAVADLDDTHRLVFVMHDVEGYTHQEIAAAMDTPVGTAKARLSRARGKLRDALAGFGRGLSLEME